MIHLIHACQVNDKYLTKEHVELFKGQMLEVIRVVRERPDFITGRSGEVTSGESKEGSSTSSPTATLTAQPLEITYTSRSGGQASGQSEGQVSGGQPAVGTGAQERAALQMAAGSPASGKKLYSAAVAGSLVAGSAVASSAVAGSMVAGGAATAAGSVTEPSSDAEYYTPLGSPDESRRNSIAPAVANVAVRRGGVGN
jgi:hypothetical protein